MERHCSGFGLLAAGAIVTLIGLMIAISATFEVPRHWTVFMVGVALLVAGAVRHRIGRFRDERPDASARRT